MTARQARARRRDRLALFSRAFHLWAMKDGGTTQQFMALFPQWRGLKPRPMWVSRLYMPSFTIDFTPVEESQIPPWIPGAGW